MKTKEVRRLSKWAYKGDVDAQFEYGYALFYGNGCTQNEDLGLCFLIIAEENGSLDAKEFLDEYYFDDNADTEGND